MKQFYKKKELKAYGHDHLPIFKNQIDIPKNYLTLLVKLQADGEIKKDDLVGFHLKSKNECYPLFKMNRTLEIFESERIPEGYRGIQRYESTKTKAFWRMNGMNLPITKDMCISKKGQEDIHFFYNSDRLHTVKGLFTQEILKRFNLLINEHPIVSFYRTKYTYHPLYKVSAPYNDIIVMYDFDYTRYDKIPGHFFTQDQIVRYGLSPVQEQEFPNLIYYFNADHQKYKREIPKCELYYDRSKEERYRIRLLIDRSFHPRNWEEKAIRLF